MKKNIDLSVQHLEVMILRVYEDAAMLGLKPVEMIEHRFREKVLLPLKEIMALADNIQGEIVNNSGIMPHLGKKTAKGVMEWLSDAHKSLHGRENLENGQNHV